LARVEHRGGDVSDPRALDRALELLVLRQLLEIRVRERAQLGQDGIEASERLGG
jgi:hypothetical protein